MTDRHLKAVDDLLAPAAVLEFSDDLRIPDIEPLQSFLGARLGELAAQEQDADARWAAQRLAELTDAACRDLEDELVIWQEVLTEGRAGQPGPVQTLRQGLGFRWNRLIDTASRFASHPDYRPRWHRLRYLCVEHAEFVEQADQGMQRGSLDGDRSHP
ncbi:hypothetical protein B6R96_36300 (plasmid) [Streptomyces sp. Sge12]|uniref:hypothetical protein n=1 Tax=Streptomyces sp. Sge12 TaxID=1972846 RepID=UPI0009C32C16|nr:hypothetical protein [Streptomyces sp. Sge12]ARE79481.1 hypothetical protein B6R96_36300 [Streptomyces sp. Sge12]